MSNNLAIIILAAGRGTRMKSDLPKVLHKIANLEMINLVINAVSELNALQNIVIINDSLKDYQEIQTLSKQNNSIQTVIQENQFGTADAVKTAINYLNDNIDNVLILCADTALITCETLSKNIANLQYCDLSLIAFEDDDQLNQYGRLIIKGNELRAIIEFKDADEQVRKITSKNSGILAVRAKSLKKYINDIGNDNAAKEYYLTDLIGIFKDVGLNNSIIFADKNEVCGVNSRVELANCEKIMQDRIRKKMMLSGVTLHDPDSVYFSFDTQIEQDVVIEPNVYFGPGVKIKSGSVIRAFCYIENAVINKNCSIGPYARIRPQSNIGDGVKIGNFVEVKKANIKKNSKVNHLSYVGDCDIGENCNIGAGTITCNYDGFKKSVTEIADDVFVGSNCSLIAPVKIAKGSIIAAGSTINKNTSIDALAIARSKQVNIENGAKKYRNMNNKKHD